MIWTIIIIAVIIIAIMFFNDLNKDNEDLQGQSLDQKFSVIVNMLNEAAYNGQASITKFDKRQFNLYQQGSNQIIQFGYGTGSLTIIWKYKYFQKEIVHERTFDNMRNLSLFEQQKIASQFIQQMEVVIAKHKGNVLAGVVTSTPQPSESFTSAKWEQDCGSLQSFIEMTLEPSKMATPNGDLQYSKVEKNHVHVSLREPGKHQFIIIADAVGNKISCDIKFINEETTREASEFDKFIYENKYQAMGVLQTAICIAIVQTLDN